MKGKKTGGRKLGTPNKDKPLKAILMQHSMDYFFPSIPAEEVDCFFDEKKKEEFAQKNKGKLFSQYQIDLMCMKPADRAKLEQDILSYHTPKMQATAIDMSLSEEKRTLADRIERLSRGEEIEPPED